MKHDVSGTMVQFAQNIPSLLNTSVTFDYGIGKLKSQLLSEEQAEITQRASPYQWLNGILK
ncbi:MAG: hypothetical protein ABI045_06375 [Flavobacteriales bacterium]